MKMQRIIQTEIERWRWQQEQAERKDRELRRLTSQVLHERERGVAHGLNLAAQPYFKDYLQHATWELAKAWEPELRRELARFVSCLTTRHKARWPTLDYHEVPALDKPTTEVVEFHLPDLHLRTVFTVRRDPF